MAEIEKLPLTSLEIKARQLERLKEIFPEVFTEGSKVDWDKLRLTLGEDVDTGKERYSMNWPGKSECFKTIQQPSIATLVPAREESVDFDTTQNLFIEGDNLEVLKLLQKSYLGKVKMIYIDPPYNTGNDFIYPDNYSETLDTYLAYTGQVDVEGRKFSTNTETDGRFHSKWMNMMYPRLFLAKNLLREDGVIFISIDDHEVQNLRTVCNEIFGEENFVAQLVWERGRKNDAKLFSVGHEYIIVYCKFKSQALLWREEKPGAKEILNEYSRLKDLYGEDYKAIQVGIREFYEQLTLEDKNHLSLKHRRYSRVDKNGIWRDDNISWPGGNGPRYDVLHPITKMPCKVPDAGWRFATWEKFMLYYKHDFIVFRTDHTEPPILKRYLNYVSTEFDPESKRKSTGTTDEEESNVQVMPSVFYKSAQPIVVRLRDLMNGDVFPNPKDPELIGRWTSYVSEKDSIILDFFAGSATTAHAVLDLNKTDGGNRRFICVQIPEPCDEYSEAHKAGYKSITDIAKERIRRVITKIKKEQLENKTLFSEAQAPQDLGFKVFKLQKSNFNIWNAGVEKTPEAIQQQLFSHVDHISPEAEQEAILYELLLKSGFEVTTAIEQLTIEGKKVFSIAEGELLICLEKQLTHEVIKAIAERKPTRVICLDEGFQDNDQLKTNAVQMMKSKGVVNFRTV
jgi:adenine-specific DNA-methyltransferase